MAEMERRRRRVRHGQPPDQPTSPASGSPADTTGRSPAAAGEPPDEAATTPRPPTPAVRPAEPSRAATPDPKARPVPGARPENGSRPVPSPAVADTTPVHDPPATDAVLSAEDREAERGLRGLVGSGSSQVSVMAALRARDATRPTDADLAAAETDLVIIRRGWVPRDPLSR